MGKSTSKSSGNSVSQSSKFLIMKKPKFLHEISGLRSTSKTKAKGLILTQSLLYSQINIFLVLKTQTLIWVVKTNGAS